MVRSPSEARAESFDYVVITNKAVAASPSVVEQIAPVVSKDTVICIIQNGSARSDPDTWRSLNSRALLTVSVTRTRSETRSLAT